MTHALQSEPSGLGRIVERQMRNWEISRQQVGDTACTTERPVQEFIAISRAVGLPGGEVAALLNLRLGWPTFDREILQAMAGSDELRRELYEALDERDLNWLETILQGMAFGPVRRDDYYQRLCESILGLARKGHAVFIGRAADLILPQGVGLRVRITATRDFCIRSYANERGLTYEKAVREVEEIEHERARFIRHHFHIEASEQSRHDLILNMERFTAHQVADVIMATLRARGVVG